LQAFLGKVETRGNGALSRWNKLTRGSIRYDKNKEFLDEIRDAKNRKMQGRASGWQIRISK